MATFHFFTLVTKDAQYDAMRASLERVGFDESNAVFTLLDNRVGNAHEPYSAITRAVQEAQAPYVVFCHQDLIFHHGPERLEEALNAVESIDPLWAVVGNAGGTAGCELVFCVDDHAGSHDRGPKPSKVLTLDENFLVIRRDSETRCSQGLSGFHLYATDLCLNAYANGRTAYVIDYRLTHASSSLDYGGMFAVARRFERVWHARVGGTVLITPAMVLFLTRIPLLDAFLTRGFFSSPLWSRPALLRSLNRILRFARPKWLPLE